MPKDMIINIAILSIILKKYFLWIHKNELNENKN